MIRLNLKEIKNALTPSPKNCLAILKKMLVITFIYNIIYI